MAKMFYFKNVARNGTINLEAIFRSLVISIVFDYYKWDNTLKIVLITLILSMALLRFIVRICLMLSGYLISTDYNDK